MVSHHHYKNFIFWAAVAVFIFSFIPGFIKLHYVLDPHDTPYQVMNSMDWYHSPMAPLTAIFGRLFASVFGYDMLGFKILAYILGCVTTCAAGAFLYLKTHRAVMSLLITAVAVLFSSTYSYTGYWYAWDSYTYPLVMAVLLCVASWWHKPLSYAKIALLAAISAVAFGVRLPNLTMIPILSAIILVWPAEQLRKNLVNTAVYILFSFALSLLLLTVLYGSPGVWLSVLRANSLSEHGIFQLLSSIVFAFCCTAAYAGLGLLIYKGYDAVTARFSSKWIWALAAAAVFLFFLICIYMYRTTYDQSVRYIYLALAVLLSASVVVSFNTDWPTKLLAVVLFAIILIPGLGSNMAFAKHLAPMALPVFWFLFLKTKPARAVIPFCAALVLALCFTPSVFLDTSRYLRLYTDHLTTTRFRGIYAEPGEGRRLERSVAFVDSLRLNGYEVTMLGGGRARFGWEYVLLTRNPDFRHCWECNQVLINHPQYMDWVNETLESANADTAKRAFVVPMAFNFKVEKNLVELQDSLANIVAKHFPEIPAEGTSLRVFVTHTPLILINN